MLFKFLLSGKYIFGAFYFLMKFLYILKSLRYQYPRSLHIHVTFTRILIFWILYFENNFLARVDIKPLDLSKGHILVAYTTICLLFFSFSFSSFFFYSGSDFFSASPILKILQIMPIL
ncbi:hypothetical protein C2G38_577608 [Gigaspora rosea]|uniref:Uncharacterized protein n=1 Tax=Gigaspora rosea TaxID=44941 RepID=A0A397UE58_9GLOM|nr:hypothetical protein C2G38_577608 [Gigaspora rosea]